MTLTVISNKYKLSTLIHVNANATFVVAGNSTVSNLAMSDEVLIGCKIDKVIYGAAPSAYWVVERANSTVNTAVLTLTETGVIEFDGLGASIGKLLDDQNIQLKLVGSANGYLMIEMKKLGVHING